MKHFFLLFTLFSLFIVEAQSTELPWIDAEVIPFMKKKKILGMSIVYFDGDKPYFLNYGFEDEKKKRPVTKNTLYDLASITKVFTTTDLAIRVLQGKMALKDSPGKYVAKLKASKGFIKHIDLQDLATHSAGLPRELYQRVSLSEILSYLYNMKPLQPIGTYVYSNLGYGLLGYVLEGQSKKTYSEVIETDILKPLHMDATFVDVRNAWPASGAMRSNTNDMLKFLKANLGIEGPENILKAAKLCQKNYLKVSDTLSMGLGWQRLKKDKYLIIDKNGGLPGYSTYIGMIQDKKKGIVILANKSKIGATAFGRKLLSLSTKN